LITYYPPESGFFIDVFRPFESDYTSTLYGKYLDGLRRAYARHGQEEMADVWYAPDLVALGWSGGSAVGGCRFDISTPSTCLLGSLWPDLELPEIFVEPRGGWSDDRAFTPALSRTVHHALAELRMDVAYGVAGTHAVPSWQRGGYVVEPVPAVEYPKGRQSVLLRVDYGVLPDDAVDAFNYEREQLEMAA
jgi:hypothetical protein